MIEALSLLGRRRLGKRRVFCARKRGKLGSLAAMIEIILTRDLWLIFRRLDRY